MIPNDYSNVLFTIFYNNLDNIDWFIIVQSRINKLYKSHLPKLHKSKKNKQNYRKKHTEYIQIDEDILMKVDQL